MINRYAYIAGVIFLLFSALAGGVYAAEKPVSPFEIDGLGHTPEFEAMDLNGKSFSSVSLKGRVVLINFWATWCPACTSEMQSLNTLARDKGLKARGFEVVTVSVDKSTSDAREFIRKNRLGLLVLNDEKKAVSRQFKVFSLPTAFLIDRKGVIVEKFFGEYDWADKEIREKIEKLL